MAAVAVLLCKVVGQESRATNCTPAHLLEQYKCNQCISEKQFLEGIVKLLVNWLLVNIEGESNLNILHDISCTACLQPHQIRAIIMGLLCEGVTEGSILCETVQT
jgi:hypothetical protein